MQPEPKPHVSHWIAWSVIALAVGLVGFGTWWYFDQITTIYDNTIVATIKPSQKTTTPATTSATADWKTFTNTTYGYTIKYPKTDWSISSIGDASTEPDMSISNNKVNYSLSIAIVSSDSSLADYVANLKTQAASEISNSQPGNVYGTQSSLTVGGQPAIKFANSTEHASANKIDWYFVKKGSNIYQISVFKTITEGTPFDVTPYVSIAESMLSTFTFTK